MILARLIAWATRTPPTPMCVESEADVARLVAKVARAARIAPWAVHVRVRRVARSAPYSMAEVLCAAADVGLVEVERRAEVGEALP